MIKTTFIYILWDPRNNYKCYIGKADNPKKRFSTGHWCQSYWKNKSKKHTWFKSLKAKGLKPILEIIDEVPESEWGFWERHYISLYKSWGFELKNDPRRLGGQGFSTGIKQSEETKRKKSLYYLGKNYEERFKDDASNQKKKRRIALLKRWSRPPVLQYDLQGNFIKEWESASVASKALKIRSSDISAVLIYKQKSCKGFIWKYKLVPKGQ